MKAILIDPEIREVKYVYLPREERFARHAMCEIIGCNGMDYAAVSDMHDSIWVDEHGLLRMQPIHAFKLSIQADPFAGKAIIVGADHNTGASKTPYVPIDMIQRDVQWLGLILPEVTTVQEPEKGEGATRSYSRPRP